MKNKYIILALVAFIFAICLVSLFVSVNENNKTSTTSETLKNAYNITTLENNKTSSSKDLFTWQKLSENVDRYRLVLMLLGENFNKQIYDDVVFAELTSSEKKLVKDLFNYTKEHKKLPDEFSSSFTNFCTGEEFEDMFIQAYENTFYATVSKSFVISWKSDNTYYIDIRENSNLTQSNNEKFVEEYNPLTISFSENENMVGDCTISLTKIEFINEFFKSYSDSSTNAKYVRIHATVTNNSSQETYLTCKKDGQNFIGKYYGAHENVDIGWNNNYKWKVNSDIKSDVEWTLKPNQTRDICVTGVFIDEDRLKYDDKPQIDIYFVNNENTLIIPVNK